MKQFWFLLSETLISLSDFFQRIVWRLDKVIEKTVTKADSYD